MKFYLNPKESPKREEYLSIDKETGEVNVTTTTLKTDHEIKKFRASCKLVKIGEFRVILTKDGELIIY